jgi:hypothetical protein
VDPTGMFSFDPETGTINANLDDKEDMNLATTQFVLNEQRGYSKVVAKDSKGNSITFNNSEAMVNFVENNQEPFDIENFITSIGIGSSGAYVALDTFKDGTRLAKNMGNIATGLNVVSFVIDLVQVIDNPNVDTVSDLVITGIGFAGVPGTVTSIGLSYTKKGVMTAAEKMADFSMRFEKSYTNMVSQKLFGIDVKR